MSKVDQSLSELFGVDPIYSTQELTPIETNHSIVPVQETVVDTNMDELDQDIALIRNNIHSLIRSGQDAFESVIHIAKSEEKISAFEIGNAFLANLASINMQLITLHEKKKKIKNQDGSGKSDAKIVNNGGTTNIAFVGTTKDILNQIKQQGMIADDDADL